MLQDSLRETISFILIIFRFLFVDIKLFIFYSFLLIMYEVNIIAIELFYSYELAFKLVDI
jgi:hypothetical protein